VICDAVFGRQGEAWILPFQGEVSFDLKSLASFLHHRQIRDVETNRDLNRALASVRVFT
jgi:hypothetical protein